MDVAVTTLDALGRVFESTSTRLAVTVVAVALFGYGFRVGRTQLHRLDERVHPIVRDVIGALLFASGSLLSIGVILGVWEQSGQLQALWANYEFDGSSFARLFVSGVIMATAGIVTRFLRRLISNILGGAASVTDHQQEVTFRLTQVVIYSMAIITVLGIWVEDIGAILVGAGFLGIVLGMAAQQTLGSLLAGFVLMFSRPFEIGDWVIIADQYEGVVTDISIVDTRLRTVEGEYIVLPNDVVGSSAVINRSHSGRLRLEVEVGVAYGEDVERAATRAKDLASEVDLVLSAPKPTVVTKSLSDSSVELGVRFWIDRPRARKAVQARTAVTNAIKAGFDDAGIKIPFPQRELSGRVDDSRAREVVEYDDSARGDGDAVTEPTTAGPNTDGSDTEASSPSHRNADERGRPEENDGESGTK